MDMENVVPFSVAIENVVPFSMAMENVVQFSMAIGNVAPYSKVMENVVPFSTIIKNVVPFSKAVEYGTTLKTYLHRASLHHYSRKSSPVKMQKAYIKLSNQISKRSH